jgi:hypothetical protein
MNEQEIRAKALEIAVSIIGQKHSITKIDKATDEPIPISLLDHYREFASEIEGYIRGESSSQK